jgi:hypothetical protein
MGRECGTYVGEKSCTQGFAGKTEGKKILGRPKRRWEDNIKIYFQEMGKWYKLDIFGSQ